MADDEKAGWVKLWRRTMNSAVWTKPELLKLWCLCLLKANHEAKWVSIDGLGEPVQALPGQFITGRFQLHKDYYGKHKRKAKSPVSVWRWLLTLRDMENLSLEMNNRFTMVTICNWERYQCSKNKNEQTNDQQTINRRSSDDHQTITNKNDKELIENEEEVSPADFHQAFIRYFCDEYLKRTGLAYDFDGGRDGRAVKDLLKKYQPDELKIMVKAMFDDAGWGFDHASPATLYNKRNEWRRIAHGATNPYRQNTIHATTESQYNEPEPWQPAEDPSEDVPGHPPEVPTPPSVEF